jgi:hypothetical protein
VHRRPVLAIDLLDFAYIFDSVRSLWIDGVP